MKQPLRIETLDDFFWKHVHSHLDFTVDEIVQRDEMSKYSNVNFLFRIVVKSRSRRQTLYLKHAYHYLARSVRPPFDSKPHRVDPRRMIGEIRMIRLLQKLWGISVVPKILYADGSNGIVLMSDVSGGGKLLIEEFNKGRIHPEIGSTLGRYFGKLHGSTYRTRADWCGGSAWKKELDWYICTWLIGGMRKATSAHRATAFLKESQGAPQSATWGDPVYRNIFIKPRGRISCVDFDHARTYDPAFDVGILTAHWMWMELKGNRRIARDARAFLNAFFRMYHRTLEEFRIPSSDRENILKRSRQWAGIYLVSRVVNVRATSYFKKWPAWEKRVKELGVQLFLTPLS